MYLFYLVLFLSFGFNENFSVSNNVSFGYDSNPMKLSENEIFESGNLFLDKYSIGSNYVKVSTRLKTSLNLFKRKTRLDLSFKTNQYIELGEKSNNSIFLKINQPIGNYQYLKFEYTYIPDVFLREYDDGDFIYQYFDMIQDISYQCYFNLSKVSIRYQRPVFNQKNKISFILNRENHYYNKYFTEFDIEINGLKFLLNKKKSNSNYIFSYEYVLAENLTLFDGNIATAIMDRGYDENKINISYSYKFQTFTTGIKLNNINRKYTSTIAQDELHLNRNHLDQTFSMWIKFKIGNISHKLMLSNRNRYTKSSENWVEELKTFKRYDISYTIFFKKILFGDSK